MDTNTPKTTTPKNRSKYTRQLDSKMAPVQRKVAIAVGIAKDVEEAAKVAGTTPKNIYNANGNEIMQAPSIAQVIQKRVILDNLINELDNIIALNPDAPLKYSDKLRAIELKAQMAGVFDKKEGNTTINIQSFDLRSATEAELVQQLDELEKKPGNVIDAELVE